MVIVAISTTIILCVIAGPLLVLFERMTEFVYHFDKGWLMSPLFPRVMSITTFGQFATNPGKSDAIY